MRKLIVALLIALGVVFAAGSGPALALPGDPCVCIAARSPGTLPPSPILPVDRELPQTHGIYVAEYAQLLQHD